MPALQVDERFTITHDDLATVLGVSAAAITDVSHRRVMACSDGTAVVRMHVDHVRAGEERSGLVTARVGGGALRGIDVSGHAVCPESCCPRGSFLFDWHPVPFDGDVLYLHKTAHAFLVELDGRPRVRPITVEHGLGVIRISDDVSSSLAPAHDVDPVSDGRSAAIPLSDGGQCDRVAVLTLEDDRHRASWSRHTTRAVSGPSLPRTVRDWFRSGRDLGGGPLSADEVIRLHPEDFPRTRLFIRNPQVGQAVVRDGRLVVFSRGHQLHVGRGFDYSDVVEIDARGHVVARLISHDFVNVPDEKKRGLDGRFTASGRYCVLESVYRSTDPWKGRQRLLDLETRALLEVTMPRGYARWRVLDHGGEHFWAVPREAPGGDEIALARLVRA